MNTVWIIVAGLIAVTLALQWWRYSDIRALGSVRKSLTSKASSAQQLFDPALVANLPEPAQRFFNASIEQGTPVLTIAEVTMHGEFSLGTRDDHSYLPMQACQLLAPPFGFYWQVTAGRWPMSFSGSDGFLEGQSWTRFWFADLLPVARIGDNPDHALSSFGRMIADSILWVPGAFLPAPNVSWTPIDNDTVRVSVSSAGMSQAYDLTVNEAGRLTAIRFQRWSDANDDKTYKHQPFGGYLSDFQNFDGFWLPTRIVAGNHFETENYFPFFKATVDKVQFIEIRDYKSQSIDQISPRCGST